MVELRTSASSQEERVMELCQRKKEKATLELNLNEVFDG
jgi:hypothetical protein